MQSVANAKASAGCPTREEWLEFLLGRVPEATQWRHSAHLDVCRRCIDLVGELEGASDEIVRALRNYGHDDVSTKGDAVLEQFMRSLEQITPPAIDVDSAEANTPIARLFAGRFELFELLGRGAFGEVYRARDRLLHRDVAVKIPHARDSINDSDRVRLAREGAATARLHHPNIVPVFDTGDADGVPYIVAKHCTGPSLAEWLQTESGLVPARWAAELIEAVARGTQHAHENGVLHRDIKPTNILLDRVDNAIIPRLSDFGLAKVVEDLGLGVRGSTQDGALLGTVDYMAPEQAARKSSDVDGRTDVYALGVVLYELLTGRVPFKADTLRDTLSQIESAEPLPPSRLRRGLSRDLEVICLKCLEKAPDRRYRSAISLGADLRNWLEGRPIVARRASSIRRVASWCGRNRVVAMLAATLIVGTVGAIAALSVLLVRSDSARVRALRSEQVAARSLNELSSLLDDARAYTELVNGERFAAFIQVLRGRIRALRRDGDVDISILVSFARIEHRIGKSILNLRKYPDEAYGLLQESAELLTECSQKSPRDQEILRHLHLCLIDAAESAVLAGRTSDAVRRLTSASHCARGFESKDARIAAIWVIVRQSLHYAAKSEWAGESDQARHIFEATAEMVESIKTADRSDARITLAKALSLSSLGRDSEASIFERTSVSRLSPSHRTRICNEYLADWVRLRLHRLIKPTLQQVAVSPDVNAETKGMTLVDQIFSRAAFLELPNSELQWLCEMVSDQLCDLASRKRAINETSEAESVQRAHFEFAQELERRFPGEGFCLGIMSQAYQQSAKNAFARSNESAAVTDLAKARDAAAAGLRLDPGDVKMRRRFDILEERLSGR